MGGPNRALQRRPAPRPGTPTPVGEVGDEQEGLLEEWGAEAGILLPGLPKLHVHPLDVVAARPGGRGEGRRHRRVDLG